MEKPTSLLGTQVRKVVFGLLVVATIFSLVLRFYHLQADPPLWKLIYNTDEGHYSYTAHNKILYGHWFVNDAKYGLITPLFAFTQCLVSLMAGGETSIATYRLVSVLCGIVSCLLMAFFFKDPWRRLIAVAMSSVSFIAFVHSRLGITEMMVALTLQISFLAAGHSFKRNNFLMATLSGTAGVGAIMVKPTAMFLFPALIIAPFLCRKKFWPHRRYWSGLGLGAAIVLMLWIAIVVAPNWTAWRYFLAQGSAAGREGMSFGLKGIQNLGGFLFSPALFTLSCLWPLALCWCFIVWIPEWRKGQNGFFDTLVFLWIAAGVGVLGVTDYQPARWQVMLFPPVIYAGLRFLQTMQKPWMAAVGLIMVIGLSGIYALRAAGETGLGFLKIHPETGMLGDPILVPTVVIVFCAVWFIARSIGTGRYQRLAAGFIAVEFATQCCFHAKFTFPSFNQVSPWETAARDLKKLPDYDSAIFSGDLVQDFSLRTKIHALPTYYLIDKDKLSDAAMKDFFVRQNCVPTYFMVIDGSVPDFVAHAPAFADSLDIVHQYPLNIGGIGFHNLYLCKFTSYDWLGITNQQAAVKPTPASSDVKDAPPLPSK